VPEEDGAYRCSLANADHAESVVFAEALEELLGPLDNPRYLIPRYVAPEPPRSTIGALGLALRWAIAGRVSDRVVYHAVPAVLAANKARVEAFERAWHRYVNPGQALYAQDARAQAILAVNRGASPFETRSELRTVWR
jgi:hypothetical protein